MNAGLPDGAGEKTRPGPAVVSLWWAGAGWSGAGARDSLSEDEKAKCGRYIREKDRASCEASRVLCRKALSGACGLTPGELVFGPGPNGKPLLLNGRGESHSLRFNLSHTEGGIILAASRETEVGVDVEKIAPRADTALIARRFFSPDEALTLSTLAGDERLKRFLALWTLKEAAIKALGGGIFLGLAGIRFSFRQDGSLSFSLGEGFPGEGADLEFALFTPAPGYVAAVAAFGRFSVAEFKAAEGPGFAPADFKPEWATPGFAVKIP